VYAAGELHVLQLGRALQDASIKPSFLESNATRLINLDRANDVPSHGTAVQVASCIKTRVESADVINARIYEIL
jgi:hypothetical protein